MIGVIGVLWLIGMEKECEEVVSIKIRYIFRVYMLVEKGGVIGVLWLIGMEKECEEVVSIKISFRVYMLVEKGRVGGGHTPTFSPR